MCFTNGKGASQKWHNKTKWFSSWFCLIILHENKQGKSEGFDSCDQVVADSNFKYVLEIKDVPKFKDAHT